MFLDIADDLRILALSLGPGCGGIEPVTVAAGNVGDVPNGIGTGTVLQRTARHGIGEALEGTMRAAMRTCVVVGGAVIS